MKVAAEVPVRDQVILEDGVPVGRGVTEVQLPGRQSPMAKGPEGSEPSHHVVGGQPGRGSLRPIDEHNRVRKPSPPQRGQGAFEVALEPAGDRGDAVSPFHLRKS